MDVKDIDRLDHIIQRGRPLQSGDHLYRAGDDFTSIYAVRSGSIKTYLIDDDGREVVINDHDRLNEICHKAR